LQIFLKKSKKTAFLLEKPAISGIIPIVLRQHNQSPEGQVLRALGPRQIIY
jgi:hypothetical protein